MNTTDNTNAPQQDLKDNKPSILAVDDNPTVLHFLASTLEKEGYSIVKATNGIEAMTAIASHPEEFDAILLDRMMPEMDGMEVTRKILADKELKHIPIIMQTSADHPEQISEGIQAGVFYYLTKPIERTTLLSIVSSAVKEIKQRKQLKAQMQRHRMSFGLIRELTGRCKTLEEAENLSSFIANCFPDSDRALTGISELLINAVEHGNLDISYDHKTKLLQENNWREEVTRRLQLPEFANRDVIVTFKKEQKAYYLQITDQGNGFNWKTFLQFDPSRASHNHGRGVAMANMLAFDQLRYNEKGNQVVAVMHCTEENLPT